jgi:MFS transporter, DHA1 family, multidrug resistance protein
MSATKPQAVTIGFVALLGALATLSPFAMDTYVPAIAAVGAALGASPIETQQTLSAYVLGLAIMGMWHGAISDAVGRRPVVIASLAVYTLASLGCALAANVHTLIGFRFVQGLAGGGGMIIVRAIVRDTLDGPAAQRLLSSVMLTFSVAPAVAPIVGGWLYELSGWRSIFWFLFVFGVLLVAWAAFALPETLAPAQRQSLEPRSLARSYARVLRSPRFWLLTALAGCSFQVFFQYVGAASPFLIGDLGLKETQFGYLFMPVVTGFVIGSSISGRTAGRWSRRRTVGTALAILFVATIWNVLWHLAFPPGVVPSIAPIALAAVGIALIMPISQLMVLDLFPETRGLAASCQVTAQLLIGVVDIGFVSLELARSPLHLAWGALGWTLAAAIAWAIYLKGPRPAR